MPENFENQPQQQKKLETAQSAKFETNLGVEQPQPTQEGPKDPKKRSSLLTALAVVLALGGAVFGGSLLGHSSPDSVDAKTAQQWQQEYQTQVAGHVLAVEQVSQSDVAKEIATMKLDARSEAQLKADIQSGKMRLVRLGLLDNCTVDNDMVEVSSGSFRRVVDLTDSVTMVAVPVPATGPANILIRGAHDGGGGITVSAVANGRNLHLPVMSVGQAVPVVIQ